MLSLLKLLKQRKRLEMTVPGPVFVEDRPDIVEVGEGLIEDAGVVDCSGDRTIRKLTIRRCCQEGNLLLTGLCWSKLRSPIAIPEAIGPEDSKLTCASPCISIFTVVYKNS